MVTKDPLCRLGVSEGREDGPEMWELSVIACLFVLPAPMLNLGHLHEGSSSPSLAIILHYITQDYRV